MTESLGFGFWVFEFLILDWIGFDWVVEIMNNSLLFLCKDFSWWIDLYMIREFNL